MLYFIVLLLIIVIIGTLYIIESLKRKGVTVRAARERVEGGQRRGEGGGVGEGAERERSVSVACM